MSRPLILKTLVVSAVGLGLGAGAMSLRTKSNPLPMGRQPASISKAKLAPPLMMGKHLSVVQVAVQAPEGIPEEETQVTTLVGWVRLNQPVTDDIHFRWELPEGVSVVEGDTDNAWSGLQSGQTVETRLKVTGFSKENLKQVVLHGFIKTNESEFGNSAGLSSRPEDSYELLTASSSSDTGSQKVRAAASLEEPRAVLRGKVMR